MPKILIVEDDDNLARGLEINLKKEGHVVMRARKGETAITMVQREAPDLITLDVMLPGISGLDVCRELRARGIATPIIMLSARGDELDRVLGLEIGADDYLGKPFSLRELLARIRARLRATAPMPQQQVGDLEVDLQRFAVTRNGRPVDLTAREFEILRLLVRHRGAVVTRNQILDVVWGGDASISPRTVDTHVMNLRRKIESEADAPQLIQSIYGEGYRLAG